MQQHFFWLSDVKLLIPFLWNKILTSIITKYVDKTAKMIWLYLIIPNEGW